MQEIALYFENGLFLKAKSFGASGTKVGEVVFNTSMTGYQEIVTDPSYTGQFVTFTMPEIGIVGCNEEDMESKGTFCSGIIVRNYHEEPSNFRAKESLSALLKRFGVLGICDIDTRALTKMIRSEGAMMMIASTEIPDKEALAKALEESPRIEEVDYIEQVSTKEPYEYTQGLYDAMHFCYTKPETDTAIAVLDFGVKRNILNHLASAGMKPKVMPHNTPSQTLIQMYQTGEIAGVFLSNGPGDPLILHEVHKTIKALIEAKIPMFGICLGHQLLSIAHGHNTFKLRFGHHGGNHPVKSLEKGSVEITAQNHNYNVPESITQIADVTHKNLFDGTIEGVRYNDAPIISVQHHPEASPGPHESAYIFKAFKTLLKGAQ